MVQPKSDILAYSVANLLLDNPAGLWQFLSLSWNDILCKKIVRTCSLFVRVLHSALFCSHKWRSFWNALQWKKAKCTFVSPAAQGQTSPSLSCYVCDNLPAELCAGSNELQACTAGQVNPSDFSVERKLKHVNWYPSLQRGTLHFVECLCGSIYLSQNIVVLSTFPLLQSTTWKKKNFSSGIRICAQMWQREFAKSWESKTAVLMFRFAWRKQLCPPPAICW